MAASFSESRCTSQREFLNEKYISFNEKRRSLTAKCCPGLFADIRALLQADCTSEVCSQLFVCVVQMASRVIAGIAGIGKWDALLAQSWLQRASRSLGAPWHGDFGPGIPYAAKIGRFFEKSWAPPTLLRKNLGILTQLKFR